jgi:hypothetical protein
MVLRRWLERQGVEVRVNRAPLTTLEPGTGTLIIAAPTQKNVSEDEITQVLRFVSAGGTLIYLAPRGETQRALARELDLVLVDRLASGGSPTDQGGASPTVVLPGSLLAGVKTLSVSAGSTVVVADARAIGATSDGALWVQRRGAGEVWMGAGPDLAENARLELADNAAFWANVGARGPVIFDESHLVAAETPPLTTNLLASALQFGFLALVFVAARAARLGPPRPSLAGRQRSAMESVRAMAALTRDAKVDAELLARLRAELRACLKERLGLAVTLPTSELVRALEAATPLGHDELETVFSGTDFLEASRALARLEASLGARV